MAVRMAVSCNVVRLRIARSSADDIASDVHDAIINTRRARCPLGCPTPQQQRFARAARLNSLSIHFT